MSTRRTIRRSLLSAAATAMMVAVPATTAGASLATGHAGLFQGHRLSATTSDSLNWAGYADLTSGGITAVNSQFTVPTATDVLPGFSATWAGIGGYNSSDLIQAGVSENNSFTTSLTGPQYSAWYEILPAAETPLTNCSGDANCTVSPGDKISVDIHTTGGNVWVVNLTDGTRWSFSITLNYTSSENSAEWIQEAPTLVVQTIPEGVGTVQFGPVSTYTDGSGTHTIAAGSPTLINESPIGVVNEATTSNLGADGQSFNVCVYAQSCAAP